MAANLVSNLAATEVADADLQAFAVLVRLRGRASSLAHSRERWSVRGRRCC